MKAVLFALFVALLRAGCGEENEFNAEYEEAKNDSSVATPIMPAPALGAILCGLAPIWGERRIFIGLVEDGVALIRFGYEFKKGRLVV